MKSYYYAGGRKIDIEPDDKHVAVDRAAAEAAGVLDSAISSGTPNLRSGIVLSEKSSLGRKVLDALHSAGALHPVFRHTQSVLVALPEVRVEYDDVTQSDAVKKLLASNFHDALIIEETNDRLTLKPRSGDSYDALKMANEIFEVAHPASSSVRFVQFISKPDVSR